MRLVTDAGRTQITVGHAIACRVGPEVWDSEEIAKNTEEHVVGT